MVNRILVGGFAAALAGAAMLAISSAPASAFTLTSPSLAPPITASHIDRVCWQQGHPGPCWGPGWGWHHRHCGYNRWGQWVCW
jgi:hypothetical protein